MSCHIKSGNLLYSDDRCIASQALRLNDIGLCKKAHFPMACELSFSLNPINTETCTNMKEGIDRDICYIELVKKNKDPNLCEYVSKTGGNQAGCFYKALGKNIDTISEKDCNTLGTYSIYSFMEACLSDAAKNDNNINLCQKVNDQGSRDMCYFNAILKNKNVDDCNKIIRQSLQEICMKNNKPAVLIGTPYQRK